LIREDEDALFLEWQARIEGRCDHGPFVPDGVACEDSWNEQEPRLLFALKEANTEEPFDLRDYMLAGANARTWNNIVRWTEAARDLADPPPWHELVEVDAARREAVLPKVAAVNVKKTGGGARADDAAIGAAARADADLIRRQMDIYGPGPGLVVVCCGTFPWLAPVLADGMETSFTSRGIGYRHMIAGGVLLEFWHPQCRFPKRLLSYAFADAVGDVLP